MKRPRSLASGACSRVCPNRARAARHAARDAGPRRRRSPRSIEASSVPRRPLWRPASTVGRVFLALGASPFLPAHDSLFLLNLSRTRRALPHRRASNIQATGLPNEPVPDAACFGEDIGRNIFFVLSANAAKIWKPSLGRAATVMRLLPDRIRVSVIERQPVAFTRHDSRLACRRQRSSARYAAATMAVITTPSRRHRPRSRRLARSRKGGWRSMGA